MKVFSRTLQIISVSSLLFLNCSFFKSDVKMKLQGAAYCLSTNIMYTGQVPTLSEVKIYLEDPILKSKYSSKSIRLASAYGFINDLKQHAILKKNNKINTPEILDLEVKILNNINNINVDLISMASEFNCYVDRFTEILDMMIEKHKDIESSNSIYGIMVGAIAAIAESYNIDSNLNSQRIVITGGILGTFFAYKALTPNVTVDFKPRSTNLKDVWYNVEKTNNYSTALWFLLTQKFDGEESPSLRDFLVKRWIDSKFLGEEGEDREMHIDLFFGNGGESSIKNLTDRREMIHQIETIISLHEQDARALIVEFIK